MVLIIVGRAPRWVEKYTNVVSELRRARPHGVMLAWLRGVRDEDLHVSAGTIGVIQAGIEITR